MLITSINAFVFISFVDYVFIEYKYWPIIDIFMLNKVYRGNTRLEKPSLPGYWNSDFIKLEFCGNGNLKSVSAIIYCITFQVTKRQHFKTMFSEQLISINCIIKNFRSKLKQMKNHVKSSFSEKKYFVISWYNELSLKLIGDSVI